MSLVVFALTIIVLVGLHEAGHFAAAKAFNVYVLEFAIGFGPRILSWKGKETRYSLRAIPFGGYVRMAGEDRLDTDLELPADRYLYAKPPWARAIVSIVAPLINILLALVVSIAIMWATPFPILNVADLVPGAPAETALAFGDRVLEIDGTVIYTNDQLSRAVQRSGGAPVSISIVRDGEPLTVTVTPEYVAEEDRYVLGAYFYPAAFTSELRSVSPDSVSGLAGLKAGDLILAIDGQSVATGLEALRVLDSRLPTSQVVLTVNRGGETLDISLDTETLTADEVVAGLELVSWDTASRRPGLVGGIVLGTQQFGLYVSMMADIVRGIFGGEIAASEAIQGPVGVARMLGEGLRLGWSVFFQLFAFLSLNFGLINLIPFPAFDGSRVAFALLEWVRGKPIRPEREGMIHAVGFFILIGLLILVTYQDILRLFR